MNSQTTHDSPTLSPEVEDEDRTQRVNGIDVALMADVIQNVTDNRLLGEARFRATNTWHGGAHNTTSIQGFYAAGAEDESRSEPFVVASDEPPLIGGDNLGANAVEIALAALASCMTGTIAYYGALQGIELTSITADLEGDMDMAGLLGIHEGTRNGFQHVRVDYRIESPEPRERIVELLGQARQASPIADLFTNPVPLTIHLVD